MPFYKGSALLQDSNTDTNGARNIVSDPANDAAFFYNDGAYLYFRQGRAPVRPHRILKTLYRSSAQIAR